MQKARRCVVLCVLAVCAALSHVAFAQDAEWYYGKPIKSVTFSGLKNIKASDLDGVTSSYVGKAFSDEVFADLLNRVFALDYFEDVTPQAVPGDSARKTVNVVLVVKENPVISRIVFLGNSDIRDSELRETISIKRNDIFIETKMLMDERAIRNLYISKGFTAARVTSAYEEVDGDITVTFRIDEGRTTVISAIQFEGNSIVSASTLKRKLSLKEAGLFNKGYFQESALEADKQAVVTYYKEHGYVDARVVDVVRETVANDAKKRDELTLTFIIQEGSQYTFGGVTFSGNKVFTTEELDALVRIKAGEQYNETKFQEGLIAVQSLYVENGYTSNLFQPLVSKDTDSKVISYQVLIEERDRSHVESITIKGNERTKDYVIEREIPIESGDIYSNTKIITALRNLYNLQYFSSVVPDVQMGSEENLVDVVFNVEEQNTITLNFGLTFSGVTNPNEFPVALFATIQDSNVFGEGKSLSSTLKLATDEQSLSASYGQGWLFNKPISMSVSAGFSHTKQFGLRNYMDSAGTLDSTGHYMEYHQFSFNLGFAMSRTWSYDWAILTGTAGISGSLIKNLYDTTLYTPVDYSVSAYGNNWSPSTSLYVAFSADGRDINYDPSKGWFASQRLTWNGLIPRINGSTFGETEFYLRSDTKGEKYFTLFQKQVSENWELKLVLALYSGLSFQVPVPGTTIKDTSALYVDGMFNGRGYSIYNLSYGRGNAMWSNFVELRFPVVPGILSFDMFLDAVTIKDTPQLLFSDFANAGDWYFSWGPSLRITMQQFPLRLLVTQNFKADANGLHSVNKYGEVVQLKDWWSNWNFVLSFNLVNR